MQVAKAINENTLLPKSIIMVCDDDIIRRLAKKSNNEDEFADIAKRTLKWLFNEIRKLILTRKDQLPEKATKHDYPVVYWTEAPHHIFFKNNSFRKK